MAQVSDNDFINQRRSSLGAGKDAHFGFGHVNLCERYFHGEGIMHKDIKSTYEIQEKP